MNREEAKSALLNYARSVIGSREGFDNFNQFAPVASQLYGWDIQNQPWCDVFVDACFIKVFGIEKAMELTYQFKGCSGAACRFSKEYYEKNGAFYKTPEVADQVFFYVNGGINHTGIVESITANSITTIEGNSSDMVRSNTYSRSNVTIAGYGRPKWDAVCDAAEEPIELVSPKRNYLCLQIGDGMIIPNDKVEAFQHLLCVWKLPLETDGQFGEETERQVKAFQKKVGLVDENGEANGIVGEDEWKEIIHVEE